MTPVARCPSRRSPGNAACRGNALLLVLWLMAPLFLLAFAATVLLRPASLRLDLHHEFARAQGVADGALQKALANLAAGKAADFGKVLDNGDAWEIASARPVPGQDATHTLEISVTGKVRSRAPLEAVAPAQAWATVSLRALARKKGGLWGVAEYVIVESSREIEP